MNNGRATKAMSFRFTAYIRQFLTFFMPDLVKHAKIIRKSEVQCLTCTFEELELPFFGKPPSIPNSAKKPDAFGGATWLTRWEPLEFTSDDWTFSTYSKRDAKDEPVAAVLGTVEDETGTVGSSGFWSYRFSLGCTE